MENSQAIPTALAGIVVLGIGSQWLASLLKIPSILLLLITGMLAGPITQFINPDQLLGDLLLPVVSLSVAVILFEGSMSLRISQLREIGRPLLMLLTVGVAITAATCSLAAFWILRLDASKSLLLGAILTVTGPTVVGPMLRHIRPMGRVGSLAKWEGIVVDPIGAILAVLVFAAARATQFAEIEDAAMIAASGFFKTLVAGTVFGAVAAYALRETLRRHWIHDHLQSPVALAMVMLTFTGSNLVQHESGLVAVTLMGLILANQRDVAVQHILHFKENLTVLLISCLFIVLTARLNLTSIAEFGWRGPAFVAVVIFMARPLSVMISTLGCGLPINERLFLSWLAPRGIVAAAVASVFALELGDADEFVSAAFLVIIGTVFVYGLTAGRIARWLGLSILDPQGIFIVSAHPGARAIGHALVKAGIHVRLVDTNPEHIKAARMEGLPTCFANILSESIHDADLGGLGKLIALTRNEEVNLLAASRGAELFGRKASYRLSFAPVMNDRYVPSLDMRSGRVLFSETATFSELDRRFAAGEIIKATKLTNEFEFHDFTSQYPEALVMFVIDAADRLTVMATDAEVTPEAGQTVIALVPPSTRERD
ncbi:MAG: sodium:proton antiporter [Planctomycetaceae bacterium]|nr:sodium:proton antiporter [Planctomycetaceae bacterium]